MRQLPLCLLLVFALPVLAEPMTVYAYQLDYRLEASGEGDYQRLLSVLQQQGLAFSLSVLPVRRAVRALDTEIQGCIFPASINATITSLPHIAQSGLIASAAIDRISLRVFTRTDSPVIRHLSELENKHVALWDGLNTDALLGDVAITIEPTTTEGIRVRMLQAQRLDAIVGFMPDVLMASEALDLPLPHYHVELALFEDEGASFVCIDTPVNRAWIEQANHLLQNLKDTGQLRQILSKHANIIE
ncbi:MAG TPA: hypothetical protein VIC08_03940 [Cellvibrionaceae bacterium]